MNDDKNPAEGNDPGLPNHANPLIAAIYQLEREPWSDARFVSIMRQALPFDEIRSMTWHQALIFSTITQFLWDYGLLLMEAKNIEEGKAGLNTPDGAPCVECLPIPFIATQLNSAGPRDFSQLVTLGLEEGPHAPGGGGYQSTSPLVASLVAALDGRASPLSGPQDSLHGRQAPFPEKKGKRAQRRKGRNGARGGQR